VDRIHLLLPASGGQENFVGISGPCERFRSGVVFADAIDGCLQVDDRYEGAALQSPLRDLGKKTSTSLSQDAEEGVNTQHDLKQKKKRSMHQVTTNDYSLCAGSRLPHQSLQGWQVQQRRYLSA
jgi:hypothetical protein